MQYQVTTMYQTGENGVCPKAAQACPNPRRLHILRTNFFLDLKFSGKVQGVAKKTVPLPNCPYLNRKLISRLDFLDLESLYDLLLESKSLSRFSRSSAFFMSCFNILGKIKVNNDFNI